MKTKELYRNNDKKLTKRYKLKQFCLKKCAAIDLCANKIIQMKGELDKQPWER